MDATTPETPKPKRRGRQPKAPADPVKPKGKPGRKPKPITQSVVWIGPVTLNYD
jgi:hypothetical protein